MKRKGVAQSLLRESKTLYHAAQPGKDAVISTWIIKPFLQRAGTDEEMARAQALYFQKNSSAG